ncbi:MAG: hypothetical protein FWH32_07640 [Clostridiales bacterium]|nr:hypothetical protein [Clostridiales bacterium]
MKKIAITIMCLLLVVASFGNVPAFASDDPPVDEATEEGSLLDDAPLSDEQPVAGSITGSAYKRHDIWVYKSHFAGKYVCEETPSFFFEVFEDNVVLSEALEAHLGYTDENAGRSMMIDHSVGLMWLHFYYYPRSGATREYSFHFYSAEMARPDSFVLRDVRVPQERRVFRKVYDGSEPHLGSLLQLDRDAARYMSEYVTPDVELTGTSAEVFFPNMGERVYFTELEKIVGRENLQVTRYDSIPAVVFFHQGFMFWYFLVVNDSYDMHAGMTTFVRATD